MTSSYRLALFQKIATVTTEAALIQTEDATLGQTVDTAAMDDMPLNGRNWASLGMLAAGTTTATTAAATGNNATGSASSTMFAVNGTSYWQNDFRLNGIDNNVEFYGGCRRAQTPLLRRRPMPFRNSNCRAAITARSSATRPAP